MVTKAKPREAEEDVVGVPAVEPEAGAPEGAAAEPVAGVTGAPVGVPLSRLKLAADNVRRGGKGDIEQLAADIGAHGLLQNLVGWQDPGGRDPTVFIVAGGRRLKALQLLKRNGAIPDDHPVAVQIVTPEAGRELSLAENFQRIGMNAGEEAEAFARLEAQGVEPGDIARRFGLTELHVKQRLRLAGLAPSVLDALKAGKISLDVAKAFASVPDQARQAEVLKDNRNSSWALSNPDQIRRLMRSVGLPSDDFIASYVGERAYVEAGGRIEADLFSDASTRLWLDGALARQLAEAKLEGDAEAFRAEMGLGGVVWGIRCVWDKTRYLIEYDFEGELGALPADVRAGLVGAVTLLPGNDGWELVLDEGAWLKDASTPVDPAEVEEPEPEADEPEKFGEDLEDKAAEPEEAADTLKPLPQALKDALAMRRRDGLALALLQDTRTARDLALFLVVETVMPAERRYGGENDLGTALAMPYPGVADPVEGALPWEGDDADRLAVALEDWAEFGHHQEQDDPPIDDGWRHLKTAADRWLAFVELPAEEKAHWGALALGRSLTAHGGAGLKAAIAQTLGVEGVSPALWRPTAENYFDRAGKARCLQFLEEVGLGDTKGWAKWKKLELASACEALAAGDSSKLGGLGGASTKAIEAAAKAWMPKELMFGGAK